MLGSIDIASRISKGRRIVTFYRAGCPACEVAIAEMGSRTTSSNTPHALVEVPSESDDKLPTRPTNWATGKLNSRWAVLQTPLTVVLEETKVVSIGNMAERSAMPAYPNEGEGRFCGDDGFANPVDRGTGVRKARDNCERQFSDKKSHCAKRFRSRCEHRM